VNIFAVRTLSTRTLYDSWPRHLISCLQKTCVLRCPLHETIWLSGSKVIEIFAAYRWLHYCKMQRSTTACQAFKCLSNFDPKASHIDATSPFLHLPYGVTGPLGAALPGSTIDVMSRRGTMLYLHCDAFVTNFRPFRARMSNSISTKGRLKKEVLVPGAITWVGRIITACFY
jgi:hypothetical protein